MLGGADNVQLLRETTGISTFDKVATNRDRTGRVYLVTKIAKNLHCLNLTILHGFGNFVAYAPHDDARMISVTLEMVGQIALVPFIEVFVVTERCLALVVLAGNQSLALEVQPRRTAPAR